MEIVGNMEISFLTRKQIGKYFCSVSIKFLIILCMCSYMIKSLVPSPKLCCTIVVKQYIFLWKGSERVLCKKITVFCHFFSFNRGHFVVATYCLLYHTNFWNILSRYCECFASGIYCDGCNCVNCFNNVENEAARREAVEATLERNPNAFRPKIASSPHGTRDSRVPSSNFFVTGDVVSNVLFFGWRDQLDIWCYIA